MISFDDRRDAGRQLADRLAALRSEDVVVLGLPRGGVPVAFEVARVLDAPLDVLLVRKLGVPFQPELAMGAIGEGDVVVYNDRVVERTRVSPEELAEVRARERAELDRRARRYRGSRAAADLTGRSAVVVDDGIATGATARAACLVARARGARRVVLAVPVAVTDSVRSLRDVADEIVCLYLCAPGSFFGVGQFYRDFAATSDNEVGRLLDESRRARTAGRPSAGDPPGRDEDIQVITGGVTLDGHLHDAGRRARPGRLRTRQR